MVSYFCAEYALNDKLHTFAGGLGILAGDTVKEMGDQGLPFVCLGLYYYKGYLAGEYDWTTPESAGLKLVRKPSGEPLMVQVPIGMRDVWVRAWEYRYKSATVYFLDAMIHQNHPFDQQISHYLYDQDIHIRLAQEMVLGIGGVRLLHALGIEPQVLHMNEGHSAFLILEKPAGARVVFTNHTVVAEGNHMYENKLITEMFTRYLASHQNISQEALLEMGKCIYPDVFSLTDMAMRNAEKVNGVSHLHTEKLRAMYPDAKPIAITNGIHEPTWLRAHTVQAGAAPLFEDDVQLVHKENKKNLLLYLQHTTGTKWDEHALILGWARRIIQYKQPLALFADVHRLSRILSESKVPVRVVLSGIPHPKDTWANDALRIILSLLAEKFRGQIVYLPNYKPQIAKLLIAGSDIWLNTPVVGLEACGTSGMKAALNGVLNVSTADGWMAEVDINTIGWKLDDSDVSTSLYRTLEECIIPAYLGYVAHHDRFGWAQKMHSSHTLIKKRFTTARMIRDYMQLMWRPGQTVENANDEAFFERAYAYKQE